MQLCIFIKVDLPAPLSPTIARTAPRRRSRSTSCRAWTAPKAFDRPRHSTNGSWATLPPFHSRNDGRSGRPRPTVSTLRQLHDAVGFGLADPEIGPGANGLEILFAHQFSAGVNGRTRIQALGLGPPA